MQLVATVLTVFSMSNTRAHHRFIQSAVFVFVGYLLVYLAFTFLSTSEVDWSDVFLLLMNALLTLLAQPLILMFERIFGAPTSLSLLELSNTNSPLLRELATTAPGTFQHSIQVANLCEEVLFEIGGDTMLARTGALYHDVGKIKNPMYFTENQHGAYSPHNDLSNTESAEIIISHVTDGIELAHKAHVPERIIDFIRTHHGTRRTDYFYINEQKAHPDEEIDPTPFTYHGPAPFSRETAVLMMADSIEAASHSLKDPDEKKISDLVDNIINKQMEAGQFLNTDLTLHDIETCRKVLKKKLMSIYHVRIAYPEK
jgi:putative nucleotidyltransferase with HDIG domain